MALETLLPRLPLTPPPLSPQPCNPPPQGAAQDLPAAVAWWAKAAAQGDASSQLALGTAYSGRDGCSTPGVAPDAAAAYKW
jgi:TPR repeat protein